MQTRIEDTSVPTVKVSYQTYLILQKEASFVQKELYLMSLGLVFVLAVVLYLQQEEQLDLHN